MKMICDNVDGNLYARGSCELVQHDHASNNHSCSKRERDMAKIAVHTSASAPEGPVVPRVLNDRALSSFCGNSEANVCYKLTN